MVAIAHNLDSDPEILYSREEQRRAIRREISALPIVEGFVIRHLYGIGCDQLTHRQLARQVGKSLDEIEIAEDFALAQLRITLRHLL